MKTTSSSSSVSGRSRRSTSDALGKRGTALSLSLSLSFSAPTKMTVARHARALLHGSLLLTWLSLSLPLLAGEAQSQSALRLQLRSQDGAVTVRGPQPTHPFAPAALTFETQAGRSGFQSTKEAVTAVWEKPLLRLQAQGAVSFWVCPRPAAHGRVQDARAFTTRNLDAGAVLSFTSTGGSWRIGAMETRAPEAKPSASAIAHEDPAGLGDGFATAENNGDTAGTAALDEAHRPVGHFRARFAARCFSESEVGRVVFAHQPVFAWNQWHHVVWTWRSVHVRCYIDGALAGTGLLPSRLAPGEATRLSVTAGRDLLTDICLFDRFLTEDEAASLTTGKDGPDLPSSASLRAWVDWGALTGRALLYVDAAQLPQAHRLEARVCRQGDTAPLARSEARAHASGLTEWIVPVTEPKALNEGTYQAEITAFDAGGKALATARSAQWKNPKRDLAWLGCPHGLDAAETILPPYTPIERKGGVFCFSRRQMELARTGLPKWIRADRRELLAGPVALAIKTPDGVMSFPGGPGLTLGEHAGHATSWTALSTSPDGHRLRICGRMEYDGVTRFDVAFEPAAPLAVQGVVLRLPYADDLPRLCHAMATSYIHRFMEIRRCRDGEGWEVAHLMWSSHAEYDQPRPPGVVLDSRWVGDLPTATRYRFTPFFHVGNFARGLAWFADNDRGWHHAFPEVPPMQLKVTDTEKALLLNVVARPVQLTEPLRFRFYLLANPFKPLPKDWRTWQLHGGGVRDRLRARSRATWNWHMGDYAKSFYPYPGGVMEKDYDDWRGAFSPDDSAIDAPFINFAIPAGSGIPSDPQFRLDCAVDPDSYRCHVNRPVADYFAYWAERTAREIGQEGNYIDEYYSDLCTRNPLASDASYIRADGTRALGYRFLEGRDFFRRLKHIYTQSGSPRSIHIHSTNLKVTPMLTFADLSMDGEHPQIWMERFTNFYALYHPLRVRGYLSGIPFGCVGLQMTAARVPEGFADRFTYSRTMLGQTLACSVLPSVPAFPVEGVRINNLRAAFGVGEETFEELRIWNEAEWLPDTAVEPERLEMGGIRCRETGEALLYVINPSEPSLNRGVTGYHPESFRPTQYTVQNGFDRLDLGAPHVHGWDAESGVSLQMANGNAKVLCPVDDMRVLWLRGASTPQAPRPEGCTLGVDFADGTTPRFGGGLLPPAQVRNSEDRSAIPPDCRSYAIGYPLIPDWRHGAVALEVALPPVNRLPTAVVGMRHHVDIDLRWILLPDNRVGLELGTREVPWSENPRWDQRIVPETMRHTVVCPLVPGRAGALVHLVVSWTLGQTVLYVDGRRLGAILQPAAPRLQSGDAPGYGLWVGDRRLAEPDAADGAVRTLLLYNHPLGPAEAAAASKATGLAPLPPQTPARPSIWLWKRKDSYLATIDASRLALPQTLTAVHCALHQDNLQGPLLARAEAKSWRGTAVLAMPETLQTETPVGTLGLGEEEEEELDATRSYLLQVTLRHGQETIQSHSYRFNIEPFEALVAGAETDQPALLLAPEMPTRPVSAPSQ